MKKIFFTIAAAAITGSVLAGGLVINTNQSAYYTRFIALQATTSVDAVYYNPAGLTKLSDGFHFSINNQVVLQTKTITNNHPWLTESPSEYVGEINAPVFPGIYAVYKKGKLALSAGFNPIGGGGGAEYATGLPSFEMGIAGLVPLLQQQLLAPLDEGVVGAGFPDPNFRNVTGYSGDIFFEGSSVYFGYQANISYEINDMISVAAGGRFVSAKNTYEGSISGVEITAVPAAYTDISPFSGSPGDYLRAIAGTTVGASQAPTLIATAIGVDGQTNVEADVTEEGTGFTPILSINITPIEMLNVAVKYEFATKLHLETTVIDGKDAGMFVDGATKVADLPAQLSVGASLTPVNKLMVAAGINYFFDKDTDYDGSTDVEVDMIDNNFLEYSLGVEYALNSMLRISVGFNGTSTGVNDAYQGEMRYSLNTKSFAGGLGIRVTPMVDINIGAHYTMYEDGSKYFSNEIPLPSYNETYDTSTLLLGAGVNFHF